MAHISLDAQVFCVTSKVVLFYERCQYLLERIEYDVENRYSEHGHWFAEHPPIKWVSQWRGTTQPITTIRGDAGQRAEAKAVLRWAATTTDGAVPKWR